MIEIRNLKFGYKDKNILNGISFSIKKGDTLSILGANGSGDAGEYSGVMGRLDGHQPAASAKPAPGTATFLRGATDFPLAGCAAV